MELNTNYTHYFHIDYTVHYMQGSSLRLRLNDALLMVLYI
jgi:hypothetical protein